MFKKFLFVIFTTLTLTGCGFLSSSTPSRSSATLSPTREYQSKTLKISLTIPADWQVEEKPNFLKLMSSQGKITVDRINTNWDTLSGYLSEIDARRNVHVIEEKEIEINNLSGIQRVEIPQGSPKKEEKIYFFYVRENELYALSTSSPELYSQLDQIAQTFKYLGT